MISRSGELSRKMSHIGAKMSRVGRVGTEHRTATEISGRLRILRDCLTALRISSDIAGIS